MQNRTLTICGLWGLLVIRGALVMALSSAAASARAQTNSEPDALPPLLPPPKQTPNVVPLSPGEQLGKDIFFDFTLSHPEGYSCATCHIPQSGFTGPSSRVNTVAGPVPGIVHGRAGRRKPQSIPYATYSPEGPYLDVVLELGTYIGGEFWDGRAPDTARQARMPFLDQNEMDNTPVGPYPPHAGGFSPLVSEKLKFRPYTPLFREVFGRDIFRTSTDEQIYDLMTAALAMYEASAEINQFSSKFDASTNGTPSTNLYTFTASESNGMNLFFGKAQCSQCHSAASFDPVLQSTQGKESFTMFCYANIGVPKNPGNPYYNQTNCDSNPEGCNPLGADFIDYGLGANPNPAPDGSLFMINTPGDVQETRGLFKAPSLRNVDMRPYPGFVKSYMHNGVFKSLEEVVHFYNKRNIATNSAGLEQEFTLAPGISPPDGYTPVFPPPEVLDNLQNSSGLSPTEAANLGDFPDDGNPGVGLNGQVGNLQLSAQEETDLVNFLKTLTDGYTSPNPVTPNLSSTLAAALSQPGPPSFVMQLAGVTGHIYVVQTSANLKDWFAVSTNILTSPIANITNTLTPGASHQFWRAVTEQ